MQMSGRSLVASEDGRYKFTGKERDASTGLDHLGDRNYDSWLGRSFSVDPLCFKYPSLSPYSYANNNPVLIIDANGDSLLVNNMPFDLQYNVISSVSNITSTSLYVTESGMLAETPTFNFNGETIHLASAYGTPSGNGSSEAASFLNYAMGDETIVNIAGASTIGSQAAGQLIRLNSNQIQSFINGTPSELNNQTMGYGLVFLHELVHTDIGQSYFKSPSPIVDPTSEQGTGPVVDYINRIRAQLGSSFGQRMNYEAFPLSNGFHYLPFNSAIGNSKIIF